MQENKTVWSPILDPEAAALIMVDIQNDFCGNAAR